MNKMTREALERRIKELSFARLETQLFLDTHPECAAALEHFRRYGEELDSLTEQYEGQYGPLTVGGIRGDRWSWIDTPWPWQNDMGGEE